MKSKRSLAIACLLALAVVAAGCGGGDDNGAGAGEVTASGITKAEFIQKADQICSDGVAEIQNRLQVEFGTLSGPPTGDQLDKVAEIAGGGVKDEVAKIRELGAPAGDEDQIQEFLDAAESGADAIIDNPDQLQGGGEPNADLTKANQLATAYGLKVCGQTG
jgi:hypothetical protein